MFLESGPVDEVASSTADALLTYGGERLPGKEPLGQLLTPS